MGHMVTWHKQQVNLAEFFLKSLHLKMEHLRTIVTSVLTNRVLAGLFDSLNAVIICLAKTVVILVEMGVRNHTNLEI